MKLLPLLLRLGGILLILSIFISIYILLSIVAMSILIVPLTFIYAKLVGQSYNFTIDQSDILYKLNKIGQYTIIIVLVCLVSYFLLKKSIF
jgi:hypothetical protein